MNNPSEYRIGVDIGGTFVKIGVVRDDSELVFKDSFPMRADTLADGTPAVMNDIIVRCRELMERYPVTDIGVGCPGDKDKRGMTVVYAGNLPFRNLHIVEALEKGCGKTVYLDNDGNCALVAEWLVGAGGSGRDIVAVTIGTGIGGGCIVNGDVMRGVDNDAGELGHFVIDPNGPDCTCGQKGCFERFASATALVASTAKAAKENPGSLLAKEAESGVDGRTVFTAARAGCPVALAVLDDYGKHLATGLNGLYYIFAPDCILLAGGVTKEGDYLLGFVRPYLRHPEKVRIAKLGSDAGVIGAALLHRFRDYYAALRKGGL